MAAVSSLLTASTILSGVNSVVGGINESKQREYEAKVQEQQAAQEEAKALESERDFRKKQSAALAEYRAAAGAGGVSLSSGSPLAAFTDFAGETELQAQRIRRGGQISATRLQQQAQLSRMAGSNALIGGFGRAGSTLLSGFARAKEAKRPS